MLVLLYPILLACVVQYGPFTAGADYSLLTPDQLPMSWVCFPER